MRAKKSYGQHFLKEEPIAARIADSLRLRDAYTRVLEVGPGMGMLTKYLLALPDKELWAVEADNDMVAYLQTHYAQLSPHLISHDFLSWDMPAWAGGQPFALIGNFPYNISSQILFKMLDHKELIPEMVGMFQREVAERVVAKTDTDGYGILSVMMQAYYEAEYLFTVKAGSFNPPPKVQSAVIRLTRRAVWTLDCDENLFRVLVRTTFGQRRKMLRNTMKAFLPKEMLFEDAFFQKRPEQLSIAEFVVLAQRVQAQIQS